MVFAKVSCAFEKSRVKTMNLRWEAQTECETLTELSDIFEVDETFF